MKEEFACIQIGSCVTGQGPVVARHADGRVTIDTSVSLLTGIPVGRTIRRSPSTASA